MVSLEPFWYFSGQKIDPSNCVFFVCLTFSPERYLFICHLDDFGKGAAIFGLFGMIKQVTLILALQMKQVISF